MNRGVSVGLLILVLLRPAATAAQAAPPPEVIADIQVHGNNVTPDADILALLGVARGDVFLSSTVADVRARLLRSDRFEGVEVLKRFASIADPSRITLVVVVDEHPVSLVRAAAGAGAEPHARRRGPLGRALFLPILDGEDGYGLTYGVLTAFPDVAGPRSRLSFPVSWGGRKRAAVEIERRWQGPISRVRGGVSIERRTNPSFELDDDRVRVFARAERAWADVRAGATVAWERVDFDGTREAWRSASVDVTLDTRLDPVLPRNAVYAGAVWTRAVGEATGALTRTALDLRGYVGLVVQVVAIARIEHDGADRALPPYFKPLLGGWSSLRGLRAGAFAGDQRTVGSLELRLPVSSPLSVGKVGISVFADAGKSYDRGVRFDQSPWRRGVGAGIWAAATVLQAGVAVARGSTGDTRITAGFGLTF